MNSKKIMPPTWLLAAIIAMVGLHFLIPLGLIIPQFWNLTGLLLITLGVSMNLVANRAFQRARTTVKPFEESSALVTNSVFRISRNPMYLGFVLILMGIAVLLRSLSPYLVIFAFAILIDRIYIQAEEKMLAEKFGPTWKGYKAKTRRWL